LHACRSTLEDPRLISVMMWEYMAQLLCGKPTGTNIADTAFDYNAIALFRAKEETIVAKH
jgi:hypothetical protein